MIIAGKYSFNKGAEVIEQRWPGLLREIEDIVANVPAQQHKTKRSREKTMRGQMLYSPKALNAIFSRAFGRRQWSKVRVQCEYSSDYYLKGYQGPKLRSGAFREMDFIKDRLGVEVQFGKYAFMVYNVCAKMTIFHNLDLIDAGVEIVPVKSFVDDMSSGVSYYEQFLWDLEQRGVSNIDIPVLVLGVDIGPGTQDTLVSPTRKGAP